MVGAEVQFVSGTCSFELVVNFFDYASASYGVEVVVCCESGERLAVDCSCDVDRYLVTAGCGSFNVDEFGCLSALNVDLFLYFFITWYRVRYFDFEVGVAIYGDCGSGFYDCFKANKSVFLAVGQRQVGCCYDIDCFGAYCVCVVAGNCVFERLSSGVFATDV